MIKKENKPTFILICVVLFLLINTFSGIQHYFADEPFTMPYFKWIHDNLPIWFVSSAMIITIISAITIWILPDRYDKLRQLVALTAVVITPFMVLVEYNNRASKFIKGILVTLSLFFVLAYVYDTYIKAARKQEE